MEELQPFEESPRKSSKVKFFIGGGILIAAIVYLITSSLSANVQYFLTVEETLNKQMAGELANRNIRVSGAVLGDSIEYNIDTLELRFTIAHVPADNKLLKEQGGLGEALHQAVIDPQRPHLDVYYTGPIPDLLQNEAQAIITGEVVSDGVIQAEQILLKCPTKYEGSIPEQSGLDS
jgi:cytochrome c-type biogenesis protein CcmE